MSELENDQDNRTLFCGNLPDSVTEAILYELFLQAGPLDRVHIPKDKNGVQRAFGFVTYSHTVSVQYAIELFFGTRLFNREISIKQRNGNNSNNNQQRINQQQQQQQQQYQYQQQLNLQQQQIMPQSNPFQQMQSTSLTSGFNQNPYPKINNMLPTDRHNSHKRQANDLFASQLADIKALLSMGSNMLQTGSSQSVDNNNSSRNKTRFDNRPYSRKDTSPTNRQRSSTPPPSQSSSLTSNRHQHDNQRSQHYHHHDNRSSSSRNNDYDRNRSGGRDSGHRRNRR